MTWAKLDDRYDDNRKIKRAWRKDRAAVAIHAMAITYCSRHRTDGIVDIDWLEERLPAQRERAKTLAVLVETGLFDVLDGEHWYVHDYLDFNPSRAAKEDASDAARNAALVRWSKEQDARRDAAPHADGNADRTAACVPDPMPLPTRPDPTTKALSDTSDVRTVFDEWIKVTNRTGQTVLSEKRRRLIRSALKTYPLVDVLDAVRGWRRSPHHRGENQVGTVYNDLELLLRDAANVERFRDLERGTGGRPVASGPVGGGPGSVSDIQAAMAKTRNAA